jgi:hypothetical protein
MPIRIAFAGALLLADDAPLLLLLLLLLELPQAAIHSPQIAHAASVGSDPSSRLVFLLSNLVTS